MKSMVEKPSSGWLPTEKIQSFIGLSVAVGIVGIVALCAYVFVAVLIG